MNSKNVEDQIVENYQKDEKMMVLVFTQWCVNNNLDPEDLYTRAYPTQTKNHTLKEAIDLTVPKEEAGDIADETLLGVLSLFGNDDLAFVVTEEIDKLKKRRAETK
ncbi:hypothetical protein [Texcoconibacillus texcoconensis]|uniref:YxiS n=1 Tax=Texcoconibacillus texcoconensis TaxID=1095777 RepID=A0A840QQZ2_9BACI|nr:hypothetical protein [Texcoconibacillus texcoconensis]MBB5173717.1 hypothetical protein [Texcoconibacillus texcoconensis]